MEHDLGVYLQCAKPAGEPRPDGGGPAERPTIQLGAEAGQPPRACARLEEVLSPKDVDPELEAYLRADAAGDAQAATNLGALFERKGDLEAALAAYRRAERRGDVNGSFNLGCLLAEMGDLAGAEAALRRADERGDAAAASNLGVLLEEARDLDGALAAYRRADERGDAAGAFNLGLLLAGRGDLAGSRAAYGRAAERGYPEAQEQALAGITVEEPQVAVPELHEGSRMRWIASLCVLALVAIVLARRRRRRGR